MSPLPRFATNDPSNHESVAASLRSLFSQLNKGLAEPPSLSIATAYINPGGFSLLAEELMKAPKVRLLLGAEPDQSVSKSIETDDPNKSERLDAALESHQAWLASERDQMGFTRESLAYSKQMVEWLESKNERGENRVEVKRFSHGFLHGKAFIVESPIDPEMLTGSSNMTYAGLALNAELNIAGDHDQVKKSLEWFENYWKQSSDFDLAGLYKAQWEAYSPWDVFVRMLYELYGSTLGDDQRFESPLFQLTSFQQDGVVRMKRLLDSLGGVLVADEVGLGKSFMAGELIREATERNKQRVLILAPASIEASMWEPFLTKYGFNRWVSVMSYDALREKLSEGNPDYDKTMLDLEQYAMVVVDEAHNLRNSSAKRSLAVEKAILAGGSKKVVLLTATPVNNSLMDLDALLRLFIRNDSQFANINIPSIRRYIESAQKRDPETLRPEHLFDLMDQVAVKRTRKFIQTHYKNQTVIAGDGKELVVEFPEPKPYKIEYDLDSQGSALVDSVISALHTPDDEIKPRYQEVKLDPDRLILARYLSSRYRKDQVLESLQVRNAGLLRSALLKRLESSPAALKNTLETLLSSHRSFLEGLNQGYVFTGSTLTNWSEETSSGDADLDDFLSSLDEDELEKAEPIDLFHADDLIDDVQRDIVLLEKLLEQASKSLNHKDSKFEKLLEELSTIAAESEKPDPAQKSRSTTDRRKVIIFSTFTDTVMDLHRRLEEAKANSEGHLFEYLDRLAPPIMGSERQSKVAGNHGGVDQARRSHVLEKFAPKTIGLEYESKEELDQFDILVTTDVLAEGVNLQQAGRIINYDLPWNPMRIVQRHGRVDRIGSPHPEVNLGLFFPAEKLDEMLGLEERIKRKVAQAEAAVGQVGLDVFSSNLGTEVNLADSVEAINQIKDLLVNRGSNLAQSGEEYRRRLKTYISLSPKNEKKLKQLPFGIGSGFENPNVGHSGYVFCIRLGEHDSPWFRFVKTDEEWNAELSEDGSPVVSEENLVSLVIADPKSESMERLVSEKAFDKAFDAWQIARDNALSSYLMLTDPATVEPKPPKSFREAKKLVMSSGAHLTGKKVDETCLRLQSVPLKKVELMVGKVLNSDSSDQLKIDQIIKILEENGVQANPKPKPLPPIGKEQVRLVAWMAVKGTHNAA